MGDIANVPHKYSDQTKRVPHEVKIGIYKKEFRIEAWYTIIVSKWQQPSRRSCFPGNSPHCNDQSIY